MADDKRYAPDSLAGVPKITPEAVRAYKKRPHDFEKEFRILQRDNPTLAKELMIKAEENGRDIAEKQAFAEGAVFAYWLISLSIHASRLEALFGPLPNGGDDGADRRPSV